VPSYTVSAESFDAIEKEWLDLLPQAANDNFFLLPLWNRLWWQAFGNDKERLLLAAREGGRLVGIAPLVRDGSQAHLGDTRILDYADFVVARGHEAGFYSGLLDALEARGITRLSVKSVPSTSPTLNYLIEQARARGYSTVCTEQEDVCPRIELPASWDDYLALLSKKDRHELRRKIRNLLDRRQVRWYALSGLQVQRQDLEDFLRLFRLSRDEKARFLDPVMEGFFWNMATAMGQAGYLRLFFMELEGARVAATVCFDYGNELLLYNSGFEPAYGRLSVGLLLKAFCLKEAIEAGKKTFDFLRGSEDYKYNLGGRDTTIHCCTLEKA